MDCKKCNGNGFVERTYNGKLTKINCSLCYVKPEPEPKQIKHLSKEAAAAVATLGVMLQVLNKYEAK